MIALDRSVRLVGVQFGFSNPKLIPASMRCLKPETSDEREKRKTSSQEAHVLGPITNVSVVVFLHDLESSGFTLVNAYCKTCVDSKYHDRRKAYHRARFIFARPEHAIIPDVFKEHRDQVRRELYAFSRSAAWLVRVFLYPFQQNGQPSPDQTVLNFSLVNRIPLYQSNGQHIMVWQKDGSDMRIGAAPVPLRPKACLRIVSGTIQLSRPECVASEKETV